MKKMTCNHIIVLLILFSFISSPVFAQNVKDQLEECKKSKGDLQLEFNKSQKEIARLKSVAVAPKPAKTVTDSLPDCDAALQIVRDSFKIVVQKQLNAEKKAANEVKALREDLKRKAAMHSREKQVLETEIADYQRQLKKLKGVFAYSDQAQETTLHSAESYRTSTLKFGGKSFESFVITDPSKLNMEIFIKKNGQSISDVKKYLEGRQQEVIFAANGGMYTQTRDAQGLLIIDGKQGKPIDNSQPNNGTNFYLQPNGVFYIDNQGNGHIKETEDYIRSKLKPVFATQSGPMLVIDNKIHHKLSPWGTSEKVRSGVGVNDKGEIVFVLSKEPTNFYTFAQMFKEHFHCPNALFLDGVISKMYSKYGRTKELGGNFGPVITVTKDKNIPVIKAGADTKPDSIPIIKGSQEAKPDSIPVIKPNRF